MSHVLRYLLLGLVLLLAALGLDYWLPRRVLSEGPPSFGALRLLRSLLVLLGSWLVATGIVRLSPGGNPSRRADVRRPANAEPRSRERSWPPAMRGAVLAIAGASLLFTALFLISPTAFSRLGQEDAAVEMLSAIACFMASLCFAIAGWRQLRRPGRLSRSTLVGTAGLAGLLFLIGMEEVSWFQRVLSIETPAAFSANRQGEFNLHNVYTNLFENAYYFSTWLLLVFAPFVGHFAGPARSPLVRFFTPSLFVLAASATAFAYNYDMWNVFFTQVTFFFTVVALWYTAVSSAGERTLFLLLLVTLVLTQGVFLLLGGRFVRVYDVTEYKELFLPLGLLCYATELLARSASPPPSTSAASPAASRGGWRGAPRW